MSFKGVENPRLPSLYIYETLDIKILSTIGSVIQFHSELSINPLGYEFNFFQTITLGYMAHVAIHYFAVVITSPEQSALHHHTLLIEKYSHNLPFLHHL